MLLRDTEMNSLMIDTADFAVAFQIMVNNMFANSYIL